MCFHTKQTKKVKEVEKRFNAKFDHAATFQSEELINGFSFPKTAIITNKTPNIISQYNWGLVPAWSKDSSIRQYTLNARVETLTEKPSFKNIINQRCLVLVNGFYEWKWLNAKGTKKQKYLLRLPKDELFAFAGLWSSWKSEGVEIYSYTIVTTEANELMAEIHNSKRRMPIVLSTQNENDWLQGAGIEGFTKSDIKLEAVEMSSQQSLF